MSALELVVLAHLPPLNGDSDGSASSGHAHYAKACMKVNLAAATGPTGGRVDWLIQCA